MKTTKTKPIELKTKDTVDFSKDLYINPFAAPLIRLYSVLKRTKDFSEIEKTLLEINEQFGQGQFVCSFSELNRSLELPNI